MGCGGGRRHSLALWCARYSAGSRRLSQATTCFDHNTLQLQCHPAPEPERFALTSHHPDTLYLESLFLGDTPKLKDLELRRVYLPWPSLVVPGLKRLSLSSLGPSIGVEHMLNILCNLPTLVTLELIGVGGPRATDHLTSPISCALRELKSLRLHQTSRIIQNCVLQHVQKPLSKVGS